MRPFKLKAGAPVTGSPDGGSGRLAGIVMDNADMRFGLSSDVVCGKRGTEVASYGISIGSLRRIASGHDTGVRYANSTLSLIELDPSTSLELGYGTLTDIS